MSVQPGSESRENSTGTSTQKDLPDLDAAFAELRGAFKKVINVASEHASAILEDGLKAADTIRVDFESVLDDSLKKGNDATLAALKAGMTTKGATLEAELKLITPGLTALMLKAPKVYESPAYAKAHELFAQGLATNNVDTQKEARVACLVAFSDAGYDLSTLGSGPLSKVAGMLASTLSETTAESKFRERLVRSMAEGIIEGSHVVGTTIGGMLISNLPKPK